MKKNIFVVAIVCLFLSACASKKESVSGFIESSEKGEFVSPEDVVQYDDTVAETLSLDSFSGDNSQNCLDWAGTYEGTIPGTNSEIKITLTLSSDLKYLMVSEYVDKGKPITNEGDFKWDATGSIITLEGTEVVQYKVGENQLIQLDKDGNEIIGKLADKYVLTKSSIN